MTKRHSECKHAKRNERTSLRIGRIASRVLRDKRYSADIRALAGSVLTQLPARTKKKLGVK